MRKIFFILFILIIGILIGYFYANYRIGLKGGQPHDYVCPILTVERSDSIPDYTIIKVGTVGTTTLAFTLVNHSSTDYQIDSFDFYPGLWNNYRTDGVKYLKLYNGATQVGGSIVLNDMARVTSTPAFVLSGGSSKNFLLKLNIVGPIATSSTSTIFRIALGGITAHSVASGVSEPVYRAVDWHPLAPPATSTDDSIESAYFRIFQ